MFVLNLRTLVVRRHQIQNGDIKQSMCWDEVMVLYRQLVAALNEQKLARNVRWYIINLL
jgi:hypothetical protein